jgi:hypothetical protein
VNNTPSTSSPIPETTITKTAKVTLEVGQNVLTAQISPCTWMYDGYPFQISVALDDNGGNVHLVDKKLCFATAATSDIERMLKTVHIQQCKCDGCSNAAFDPLFVDTNRDGACESCFLAMLRANFDKEEAAEKAKLARLDVEHQARGFTHRVDAWIHRNDGDDSFVTFWMVNATDQKVRAEIKKKKSCDLDDYTIVPL